MTSTSVAAMFITWPAVLSSNDFKLDFKTCGWKHTKHRQFIKCIKWSYLYQSPQKHRQLIYIYENDHISYHSISITNITYTIFIRMWISNVYVLFWNTLCGKTAKHEFIKQYLIFFKNIWLNFLGCRLCIIFWLYDHFNPDVF